MRQWIRSAFVQILVLSPIRRLSIIWTNAKILLIGPLGTYFGETLIEIHTFSFKKMHLKLSSAKWRPFCLGLNVLTTPTITDAADAGCVLVDVEHLHDGLVQFQWGQGRNGTHEVILFRGVSVLFLRARRVYPLAPSDPVHEPRHLKGTHVIRADSRFAPSQWESALLCNDVSHWLGASLRPALVITITTHRWLFARLQYLHCVSSEDTATLY